MTKHTAIIFLGTLVALMPLLGFPSFVRDVIIILGGIGIAVLAYLSSVLYCSNCKKLIDDAEKIIPEVIADEK